MVDRQLGGANQIFFYGVFSNYERLSLYNLDSEVVTTYNIQLVPDKYIPGLNAVFTNGSLGVHKFDVTNQIDSVIPISYDSGSYSGEHFSPDGEKMVMGNYEGTGIFVFYISDSKLVDISPNR